MDFNSDDRTKSYGSSCWVYWITNSALSIVNGLSSRNKQKKDWNAEKDFQQDTTELKNQYENAKEVLETAFKLRLRDLQREYSDIQSELKLDLELQKDELSMFRRGWPLKLSLQVVQEMRRTQTALPSSLTVIIASHDNALPKGDPMTHIYDGNSGIVDTVQRTLNNLGIPKKNVLRFREDNVATGGAALANIYAMLSNFPTVVVMPRVDRDNKQLVVSIGCWSPASVIPMQRKVFELDYNEAMMCNDTAYRIAKQKEIETAYLSIAGSASDIYSLVVFGRSPRFARYVIERNLCGEYPVIGEFVKNEYRSILDPNQTRINIDGKEKDMTALLLNDKITSEVVDVINSLS